MMRPCDSISSDWRSASVHACFQCFNDMWRPPCDVCRTSPCQRGECWAHPPLHLFPYETYFANRLGSETPAWVNIEEVETEEDKVVRQRQKLRINLDSKQTKLFP